MDYWHLCMGCMTDKNSLSICPECGWRDEHLPGSFQYLPPRTVLNQRYLIGRVLGQGAFGITYLAKDIILDIRLAIKEFFPREFVFREVGHSAVSVHSRSHEEHYLYGMEKFFTEAKTLVMFEDHPNIISVRDFFKANGTAYLVMNYLEGITLKEHLLQSGSRLALWEVMEIMMPVMDALRAIHAAGILHRDISPDNIYITSDSRVVILDFGAARHAVAEKGKGLSVIIKMGYAPEEQYRSQGVQGPWTDVYAVAATIYRAITGQMPPESLDRLEQDTLIRPSMLGVDIKPNEESILLKALSVRSPKRYQTVKEFQDALRRCPDFGSGAPKPPPGNKQPSPLVNPETVEGEQHREKPHTSVEDGSEKRRVSDTSPPVQGDGAQGRVKWIEIIEGPDRGLKKKLDGKDLNIGRDPDSCELALSDEEVSRLHARLTFVQGGSILHINDLGSLNGTYVNTRQIVETTPLSLGDIICMGNTRLKFLGATQQGARPETPPVSGAINIGRSISNDVVLDDASVSRRHASIYPQQGKWYIVDLGSTHGTFLNAQPVTDPVELEPSSQIKIGNHTFSFDGHNLLAEDGAVVVSMRVSMESDSPNRRQIYFLGAAFILLMLTAVFLWYWGIYSALF